MYVRRLLAGGAILISALAVGAPSSAAAARAGAAVCTHRSDPVRQRPAQSARLMVATAHPLASEAGCRVLVEGGSAADAAVAVQMVLAVVEPQSSGLGGGTMITYYDRRSGRIESYDGLSAAPAAVTDGLRTPTAAEAAELGIDSFGADVTYTGRAVGVPGTAAVLDQIHRG